MKQTFVFDRTDTGTNQRPAWYVDGTDTSALLGLPLDDLRGETVAVSTGVARDHGWTVGSRAELRLGDGAVKQLRVVAILEDQLGLPSVLLPWALASAHSAAPVPDAVYLTPRPGSDRAALAAVASAWGVNLEPTEEYLSTLDAEFDRLSRLALLVIIGAALVYTGISVANTQLMATAGRAGEFVALRRAGATNGQIRRIVAGEALLTSAVGLTLGAAIAAAALALIVAALGPVTAVTHLVVPWPPVLAVAAGCLLLSVLAGTAVARVRG